MTTYNSFDRQNLKNLRSEMQELLAKYGINSNLDFTVGNMKFSSAEVEIKITAKVKGAKTFNQEILQSRVNALRLKMKNSSGDELVEYNTRAHKMPFVYRDGKTGKLFKAAEEVIVRKFSA